MSEYQNKIAKLLSLKKEVADFHPLLLDIFNKLPNIQRVEYTQGPNEKGADFILRKTDQTLDLTEYIGVIVKVGKIDSSKAGAEVKDQIDHCVTSARAVDNGRNKINLNQVWVLTNDTISSNAKERIYDKYSNTNIAFVDRDNLIAWIDKYFPSFWHDIPHSVNMYFNELLLRTEKLDVNSNAGLNASGFYVDQDILKINNARFNKKGFRHGSKLSSRKKLNISTFIDDVIKNQYILLEGSMGSGKSKLLRKIIQDLTAPLVFSEKLIIPVFERFSTLHESHSDSIDDLLKAHLSTELYESVKSKKFRTLILIDGLDEQDLTTSEQIESINKIKSKANENTLILMTSRNIGYLYNSEKSVDAGELIRYELAPLTIAKTIKFVENICSEINVSTRLVEGLKKSLLFKQISHSPIAAMLLARLLETNSQDIPSNITELYSQYLELSLGRWDLDKGIKNTNQEFEATENIIMNIAVYMLDNNVSELSEAHCFHFFEEYLNKRHLSINAKILFDKVIDRSHVIFQDRYSKKILFTHRSFAEYYYAKKSVKSSKGFDTGSKAFDLYWMDTTFFYIGLLKDCEDLLYELLNKDDLDILEKLFKVGQMPDYMLAGFSSPYQVVKDGLPNLFLLAAKIYMEIINRNDSPQGFSRFSQLQILSIFQYIIRHNYSYEYFLDALDTIVCAIDESDRDEETRAYALFFASVVGLELGFEEPLKYLLENYSLPIPVQIASKFEAEKLNVISKKIEKRLRKISHRFKENNIRGLIESAYNKPIGEVKKTDAVNES
jgi:hypothetical protein